MHSHRERLPCELIAEPLAQSGLFNMRADEGLLEKIVADQSYSIVRIYRWAEPTVSLGYFQKADAAVDPRLAECPRVRRMTGGGAILHDQEITYCCAVPAGHPIQKTPSALYELAHTAIITLLSECGASSTLRMNADTPADQTAMEPFLCFLRSDPRDIVSCGRKIVGSAQRRRRGNILQHGSILLSRSRLTPELLGVQDLHPKFDVEAFRQQLGSRLQSAIGTD